MNNYNLYKSTRPNWPNAQRIKNILFLVGIAIVLGLGLALAAPAHGASLAQGANGDISGTITVSGGNAAGITVDLRQHDNSGVINFAKKNDDENGVYHFRYQGSNAGYSLLRDQGDGRQRDAGCLVLFPDHLFVGAEFYGALY